MVFEDFLEKDEAAEALNVTTRTLDRWYAERIGPARTKIGRRSLYRKSALLEWLKANEQIPIREASRRA